MQQECLKSKQKIIEAIGKVETKIEQRLEVLEEKLGRIEQNVGQIQGKNPLIGKTANRSTTNNCGGGQSCKVNGRRYCRPS